MTFHEKCKIQAGPVQPIDQMRERMRVILDLDCVLCDFIGGVCRLRGVPAEDVMRLWVPGEYPMDPALSGALGRRSVMTAEEFWRPIQAAGADFWSGLEPLPWARELADLVRSLTDDWLVVTSPSRCETSYLGKLRWCRAFFGNPHFDRLAMHRYKYVYAQPGVCLVDDYDDNCRAFVHGPRWRTEPRPTGGHAVTFPAHHNHLHGYAATPMTFIRAALDSFNRMHRTPEPTPTAAQ